MHLVVSGVASMKDAKNDFENRVYFMNSFPNIPRLESVSDWNEMYGEVTRSHPDFDEHSIVILYTKVLKD